MKPKLTNKVLAYLVVLRQRMKESPVIASQACINQGRPTRQTQTKKNLYLMIALILILVCGAPSYITRLKNIIIWVLTSSGDTRGPRQVVYELCHPSVPQEAHKSPGTLPFRNISNTWASFQPHELEYISHQGGFSWLPRSVSDALIRCYFHHVHFFLPVLEASKFLDEYTRKENQDMNLLLLWSVFLAATNVCVCPPLYLSFPTDQSPVCRCRCSKTSGVLIAKGDEACYV